MTRKPTPNACKTVAKSPKTDEKRGSFGQNEAIFCRNSFIAKLLSLCALAPIYKCCVSKDLRPIMGAASTSICRKFNVRLQMRRGDFSAEKCGCITNYNIAIIGGASLVGEESYTKRESGNRVCGLSGHVLDLHSKRSGQFWWSGRDRAPARWAAPHLSSSKGQTRREAGAQSHGPRSTPPWDRRSPGCRRDGW
jgi:hypothetical protein